MNTAEERERCALWGCLAANHATGDDQEPLACRVCSCPIFTGRLPS